ncbi:LuxR C-terminal-related transcriptional regulator [Dyella tabacisoli]|uniref:DNA-binding response regulator n=1 Tax=Dyella tabacisoli TaxID=2282381 RepID=A0A369UUM6_9GAMM|nr:response regulator transcription factor [Dyella tabacisoli]RDD83428.1 DNA-binding response regulator [Dyella tabacisoli]
MIRIVVADSRGLAREGLTSLFAGHAEMLVIGQADNGLDSVRLAVEHEPDVVLMDIALPLLNGIEATRRILARSTRTRTICIAADRSIARIRAAFNAGVSGYLSDSCSFRELLDAIHAVCLQQVYLSPGIAHVLVNDYRAVQTGGVGQATAFVLLTPREREITQMLSEGHSTKDVAIRLHVSEKTVGTHREHIMQKLNLRGIAELTRYALREGLTSLEIPDHATVQPAPVSMLRRVRCV